jgi:hypothetical protein
VGGVRKNEIGETLRKRDGSCHRIVGEREERRESSGGLESLWW